MPPEARKRRTAPEAELEEALEGFEPDVEPKQPKPKAKRSRSKPKVKSSARKVKHPTGSLKSRNEKGRPDAVYEEEEALLGVVEWKSEEDDAIEEEDMFNPRRLTDDKSDDDDVDTEGPAEGTEAWAEEERIAAIVREREEWDSL
jgi:hypothetical protein